MIHAVIILEEDAARAARELGERVIPDNIAFIHPLTFGGDKVRHARRSRKSGVGERHIPLLAGVPQRQSRRGIKPSSLKGVDDYVAAQGAVNDSIHVRLQSDGQEAR